MLTPREHAGRIISANMLTKREQGTRRDRGTGREHGAARQDSNFESESTASAGPLWERFIV
jgi:hypothetical protein